VRCRRNIGGTDPFCVGGATVAFLPAVEIVQSLTGIEEGRQVQGFHLSTPVFIIGVAHVMVTISRRANAKHGTAAVVATYPIDRDTPEGGLPPQRL
jgi:hypothetical protein